MIELFERVATQDPDRPALVTGAGRTSYAELRDASLRAAAGLVHHGVTRFAILDHEADVSLPLLAAAALVGAEACQYPPVPAEAVGELAERFDHDVVVSDRTDLDGLDVQVLTSADVLHGPDVSSLPDTPPRRPHIVLTTGTTGAPKGAMHDWSRLLRTTEHTRSGAGQRWLLAYGLHQFGGQQVLIHVFASGATLVAPTPRRPREGLAAMREHDVTHVSATPTYWRFVLADMRADGLPAPSPRQVTMGGEAVPGHLLGALREAFPEASISQIYGSTEVGTTSSTGDDAPGLPASVLERGPDAPVQLKVQDGEMWIKSRIGMLGYYGDAPVDEDGWRPTGDLVEVVGDRVQFRGRSSEIINVGGVKVHPLPIEERVSGVPGVDMARVYGRPNPMTGAIVALEVVPAPGADQAALKQALRDACDDLLPAARPRSITFVDDISTSGGKILRRQAQ
ncbi:class I adenylate-forming enzyme family protein [Aeromicrobium sp. CF4.19]|uniref:class I adenylate-forming enzyme family protein n=1 Tax=Aeromicrobium sp. CF4.19 TaxID=3373082 RepID=UPI003EE7CEB4